MRRTERGDQNLGCRELSRTKRRKDCFSLTWNFGIGPELERRMSGKWREGN